MSYGTILACAAFFALLPAAHADMAWSPDGKWLAYTFRIDTPPAATGWIWQVPETSPAPIDPKGPVSPKPAVDPKPAINPKPAADPKAASPQVAAPAVSSRYQVRLASADGRYERILAESDLPLGSLAWSPDGRGLIFLRLLAPQGDQQVCEVVHHQQLDQQRVIYREAISIAKQPLALFAHGSAWRPASSEVAVTVGPRLHIVRTTDGQVLASATQATFPVWSETGDRLAYHQRLVTGRWMAHISDARFQNASGAFQTDQLLCPAVWGEGQSLLAVQLRRSTSKDSPAWTLSFVSWEPGVEGQEFFRLAEFDPSAQGLPNLPSAASSALEGCWFTRVPHSPSVLVMVRQAGKPTLIHLVDLREVNLFQGWHPVDSAIPLYDLTAAPAGDRLAFRLGQRDDSAAVLIHERLERATHVLVAAPEERLAALFAAAQATNSLVHRPLREERPTFAPPIPELPRPNRLPSADEIIRWHGRQSVRGQVPLYRLRTLLDFAAPWIDRTLDRQPGPADDRRRATAELEAFFAYVARDPQLPRLLDELEELETDPFQRLEVQTMRAQWAIVEGRLQVADDLLKALEARTEPPRSAADDPALTSRWSKYRRGLETLRAEWALRSKPPVEGATGPEE